MSPTIQEMPNVQESISQSEIKKFLYTLAKKEGWKITEFRSSPKLFFAHVEKHDHTSSTAVGPDAVSALLMCFLSLEDPRRYNFII